MQKKSLEWADTQRIIAEVTRGPWTAWLATTNKKPKDIVLGEAQLKLASRLGLPTVPKGNGVLSFGWVVDKLMEHSHNVSPPGNDPMVQAMGQLGNVARNQIPGVSNLVLNLMVHRECITKHSHNCFNYYGDKKGTVSLYSDHWSALTEDVLNWAMLQSPFAGLHSTDHDEWISEVKTQNGQLHCTSGVAVRTTKGRTLHAINGVVMTPDEFRLRGNARAILETPNVEVRRVLVEDLGVNLFIAMSGLTPVHADETGKLYRLDDKANNSWRVRHLCWVHVVCPSTQHEYMLAVPPTTRTAREGVAWTFRKLPEEYQPGQET